MTNYIKEQCPLCDQESQYCEVDHGDKKYFKCTNCGKFQIEINAEDMVRATPKDWKENASNTSKQLPDNKLLLIFMEIKKGEKTLTAKIELKENVSI